MLHHAGRYLGLAKYGYHYICYNRSYDFGAHKIIGGILKKKLVIGIVIGKITYLFLVIGF